MSSSPSASISSPRSPSPRTPEPVGYSDAVAIHSDSGLSSSWYMPITAKSGQRPWGSDSALFNPPSKVEDNDMLQLDELIEQDAYDDSPSPSFASTSTHTSPLVSDTGKMDYSQALQSDFQTNGVLVSSHNGPISATKPIPPPASLPRKLDPSSMNQRVVHPPKEACHHLPIMFPSIPEGGTKSRVETQIRVTVDLADPSSSTDMYRYDRVGSWKWLRLPPGTATKKRTRKQGKIDPNPEDVLQLAVSVTCASPPHNRVLSCSSCQVREAKRVAKKLAARVRPAKSESESDGEGGKTRKHHEDTTNIIQFNCAEVIDFETGSTVLPLRITCYCRHHREKVGFNVHFTMTDHTGRLIGSGMSRPIMITDDHKTTGANSQRNNELVAGFSSLPVNDWSQEVLRAQMPAIDTRAPSKRNKDINPVTSGKSRHKPYDAVNKSKRTSREGSVSSVASPSTNYSSPPTRSPTPSVLQQLSVAEAPSFYSPPPPLQASTQSSETSSPDTLATPLDNNSDVFIPELDIVPGIPRHGHQRSSMSLNIPNMMIPPQAHSMPFLLFDQSQASQSLQLQLPTIHRLIPNTGPTHGGIEVTILGANFHPSLQLNVVFGDIPASSTQRWSENTLVCMLPARAAPGVVSVWFEGFPKIEDHLISPPSLFTYSDESDRALMELALQVVGLKMTGKIEDAKNVAMRIVGNAGQENSSSQGGSSGMMQMSLSVADSAKDFRSMLRPTETPDMQKRILDLLSLLDAPSDDDTSPPISLAQAISYPAPSGQTLLHLATFMQFPSLVQFLVDHDADIDARDRNGYTALHFAALVQNAECAKILVEAGADQEIVNSLGKIPREISSEFFDGFAPVDVSDEEDVRTEDEEADWGDGEEDAIEDVRNKTLRRRGSQRALRKSAPTSSRVTPHESVNVSRSITPPPAPSVELLESDDKSKLSDAKEPLMDDKQTASFMEKMIQRTLAQLPAQGLIPQLPLPHLPDLPNMPWATLPQIPMVFPVFVPMAGWPSFLGGETSSEDAGKVDALPEDRKMGATAMRAAHDWWEKWVAMTAAATLRQHQEAGAQDLPPPVYTPRPSEGEIVQKRAKSSSVQESVTSIRHRAADITPEAVESAPSPDASPGSLPEVSSYQEGTPRKPKYKQNDKMLLLFWLPILLLSLLWAIHTGIRFAFQTIYAVPKSIMST